MAALETVYELKRGNVHNSGQMVAVLSGGFGWSLLCLSTMEQMAFTGRRLLRMFIEAGQVGDCRKRGPQEFTRLCWVTHFSLQCGTHMLLSWHPERQRGANRNNVGVEKVMEEQKSQLVSSFPFALSVLFVSRVDWDGPSCPFEHDLR